ncbi:MAG: hypothetical protein E7363_01130 [Clostridiales bacterium]|nr:hypothetical protein [Clostridiales bacterium]
MFIQQMKDPAFWEKVRNSEVYAETVQTILDMYQESTAKGIEELPFTVAADFAISGDRKKGEEIYFRRRRALASSALLSMIYPDEKEYFNTLQDYIFAVCNEYTWEVPAHIPNMIDYNPDDIDLFASETGYCLSEIYTILEDRLDPLIKTRIKMEVERRIILPFSNYDRKFAWIGYHSNWAAVCGGSVAAAFMYLFPERYPLVKPRIDEAINNFLLSYRESGYCYEGISYWEYGFGFFVCYAQMLYDFTNGKENLFDSEKVKAISSFPQKVFLSGNALVSFSDGNMNGKVARGICHYLAKKYPDAVFPAPQGVSCPIDLCGRWGIALRNLAWFDPTTEVVQETLTDYSLDAQWLIFRTPEYGFCAKGGCNWEAHNHNDVGSFVIATKGKQVFADIGAGEYTRQYFQDQYRYEYFNPSSRSHNVPILFGNYQKVGRTHRADGTVYDGKTLSYDFASAYEIPEVTSLKRAFTPTVEGVTLVDEITYAEGITPKAGDYVERFVLTQKPTLTEGGFTVGGLTASYTGASAPTVTEHTYPIRTEIGEMPLETVYLVDFAVTETKFTLSVSPQKK